MIINIEVLCRHKADRTGLPMLLEDKDGKNYCGISIGNVDCPNAVKNGSGYYCVYKVNTSEVCQTI